MIVELDRQQLHPIRRVVRRVLASGIRGGTRLTLLLARVFRSLQAAPVLTADGAILFLDLRLPSSHATFIGRTFEQHEQQVIRNIIAPGDVVLDIGAHNGVHTVLMSVLVHPGGSVFAFEPNPAVIPVLERTVQGLSNTTLLGIALSDRSTESLLYVPLDPSMASLRDWTRGQKGPRVTTECKERRLDEMIQSSVIPQPDFIKCDVEGGELAVFKGARRALERADGPIILYESNINTTRGFGLDLASSTEFLRTLAPARYRFFELTAEETLKQIVSPRSAHTNILAVPMSRMNRCAKLAPLMAM